MRKSRSSPRVLVADVGGSHVKLLATGEQEPRRFPSGRKLTAAKMVEQVKSATADWKYDVVTVGYPGPVLHGSVASEPFNLGKGWVAFDFEARFDCPVKLINDAAMQALGGYRNGRMLFLGLGTGLGTAFIVAGTVEPMELGHLPYRKATYEDYVGARGLERLGKKKWTKHVLAVIQTLRTALEPDEILIGGGNATKLEDLPPDCRRGSNADAFAGGFRLWKG